MSTLAVGRMRLVGFGTRHFGLTASLSSWVYLLDVWVGPVEANLRVTRKELNIEWRLR